jgi:rhodanese-related sulfurtransferase
MTQPTSTNPALGYAGDVPPAEAWRRAQAGEATLVDVRTAEELHWVGRVPGVANVQWSIGREGRRNEQFVAELEAVAPRDRPVMFLCRSGARSVSAAKAATAAGYTAAWNILEGFEGPPDASWQRGKMAGWRHAGLPWEQS